MNASFYLSITVMPIRTFQNNNKNTLYMSDSLMKHWGIVSSDVHFLCIGTKVITVTISKGSIRKDAILFDEHLFTDLPLPLLEWRFLAIYDKEKKAIFIGPIVGLVTDQVVNSDSLEPSFGSVHAFCEELAHVMKEIGGLFYVFHLKDFSRKGIHAFYFYENQWKEEVIIPPNIIYNRIHSRKLEASVFFKKFLDEINLLQIPIFNERFLSKWEVHTLLHEEEHLHPYLPKTDLLNKDSLIRFLSSYEEVYLKPIHGSQGKDILQLFKHQNKLSGQASSGKLQNEIFTFKNEESFMNWFYEFYSNHPSTYLIQQSIPLVKYQDRPIDFRVLCHKNHQGIWRVTSKVARVSAEKQFVSNISRGGVTMKPVKALQKLFGLKDALQIVALISELSFEIASIINQSLDGNVGELGIDIGVDENGKPWLIEVNSKPSKNFEEHEGKIRPSAKAILEYSTAQAFNHLKIRLKGKGE